MSTAPANLGSPPHERRSPIACPICGGEAVPALDAVDRNRGIGEETFHYSRCKSCRTLVLAGPPEDLGRYYPSEYYDLPAADELDTLAASEQHKVRMLLDRVEPGRLVEIGPGFGVFARAARSAGFEVTGVEMDARCCEYLRTVVGVQAVHSAAPAEVLSGLAPSRAIVLWHSLEHLPDPGAVLDAAAQNLEDGGVLAVATPNPGALQFRLMGARWAHLDAPRHITLIPLEALTARLSRLGLRRVHSVHDDPSGRHWNRFGWEYALRRTPSAGPARRPVALLALAITLALRPLEGHGGRGTAYTAVFRKEPA